MVDRFRALGVEGVAGDDEDRGGLAAVVEVDRLGGARARARPGTVQGGEDEVAGIEEMWGGGAQLLALACEPGGLGGDLDPGPGETALQGLRARVAVAEARGKRLGAALQSRQPVGERARSAGQPVQAAAELRGAGGQAPGAAGDLIGAARQADHASTQMLSTPAQALQFVTRGGEGEDQGLGLVGGDLQGGIFPGRLAQFRAQLAGALQRALAQLGQQVVQAEGERERAGLGGVAAFGEAPRAFGEAPDRVGRPLPAGRGLFQARGDLLGTGLGFARALAEQAGARGRAGEAGAQLADPGAGASRASARAPATARGAARRAWRAAPSPGAAGARCARRLPSGRSPPARRSGRPEAPGSARAGAGRRRR